MKVNVCTKAAVRVMALSPGVPNVTDTREPHRRVGCVFVKGSMLSCSGLIALYPFKLASG